MDQPRRRWLARCSPPRAAFSLIELLVVIAIIGMLVALQLMAVQSTRQVSQRISCTSRLRQIGLAALQHHEALRRFPAGAIARQYTASPTTPWTFYRWSALAHFTPFLEDQQAFNALDLNVPLYGATFSVTPENTEAVKQVLPVFLCPSDSGERVSNDFGPTNYAVCTGSGINGGSPRTTDGIFFVNSRTQIRQITDGTSKTVLASESTLGELGVSAHNPQTEYKFVLSAPLTAPLCAGTVQWNVTDVRGFAWVNGEYRCGLYNHHATPNSSEPDCLGVVTGGSPSIQYTPYGWRAARSRHPGGVNVLWADGSAAFVANEVEPLVWFAFSTMRGQESISAVDP